MPKKGQIIKPKVKCICEKCGEEFYRYPSQYIPGLTKYCSVSCRNSVTITRLNKTIFAKEGKSEFKCVQCGKKFYDYHRKKGRGRKFCSLKCAYSYRTKEKVKVICEECGKEFITTQYEHSRGRDRFCSKKCNSSYRSRVYSGENHWAYGIQKTYEHRKKIGEAHKGEKNYNWKGGIKTENEAIRKSFDMRDWIYQVFHRDDFTCQRCLGRGGKLHAHHIIPFAVAREERFEPDNGTTLCHDCHKWIHGNEMATA